MYDKGLLIVISGPSGAGKGSICKGLFENKIPNLELSVSVTTRKPRVGEAEGVSYFFKTEQEFLDMLQKDQFIEYAKVYGNYYGTPKEYVFNKINEGKDVILEIDIQGALKVKEAYPDGVFIFIMPPSFNELRNRIIGRGADSEADIRKRLQSAFDEIHFASKYDYIVVNDDLQSAVEKVKSIITAEKCKFKRCHIDFNAFKEE